MTTHKGKTSSYIAQYPVLRTVQSTLHFTSLTDLFTQTPSRLLWEASSHMLQLMHEGCSYTYSPLSIARYSFIQLSVLEQCRVKKLAQSYDTAARIRTRVLVVESPELYPWATAFYTSHDNGTCTYCSAWRLQPPVLSCTCCFSLSCGYIAFHSFPTCHLVKCAPAHANQWHFFSPV